MSTATLDGLGRRFVLIAALAALMVGFGASNAFAAGSITSPGSGSTLSKGVSVEVEGTLDAAADFYAIAVCAKGSGGTKCDHTEGAYIGLTPKSEFEAPLFGSITPNASFANWNFQTNQAGEGTTNCESGGCEIVLSEYDAGPPFAPLFPPATPVTVTIK